MVKILFFLKKHPSGERRKRLFYIFLGFLLFSPIISHAQTVIKGTVVDDRTDKPVVGAVVALKSETKGAFTTLEGEFVFNSNKRLPLTLSVSLVGYKTQEIDVYDADEPIIVRFVEDLNKLDEVVVVAYGTQKRGNITSAISSVKSEDIQNLPVANFEQAMQGRMAGVSVASASGIPGGAVVVNIRGTSSISAGNDPLYVVDGLPINSTDVSQRGFGGQTISPLADINPSDIENIEVLKDASASALYGSRATNGVILITTKRGSTQKTKVNFDYYIGTQDLWKKLDFLDTPQWVGAMNEAAENFNTSYGLTPTDATYKQKITAANDVTTNWMDELIRSTAVQTNYQVAVSGGDDLTKFYLSAGYYKQDGILENSGFERYSVRSNLDRKVNNKVNIGANIALSYSDNDRITSDNNIYSPWKRAMEARPDYPVYTDGKYTVTNVSNPVQLLLEPEQNTRTYRAILNLKADVNIVRNLNYHLNLGGDYTYLKESGYFPYTSLQSAGVGESGDYRSFVINNLMEHTVDYKNQFGDLSVAGLAGYSYQRKETDQNGLLGRSFISTALKYVESAGSIASGTSENKIYALQSVFGRINLGYKDKYLLEASLRSDASSKFASNKRVGYFPAASLGWRPSQEQFFRKNDILSDLKMRGSIGLTGNQEGIGYYSYYNVYGSGYNYNGVPGLAFSSEMNNPDLTWEKTLQYGLGFDAELLKGRILFTFDWFKKDTKDLLLTHDINGISGFSSMTSNVGSLTNKGFEFSVQTDNLKGALKWTTAFNISFIKNEITGLYKNLNGEEVPINTGSVNRLEVGQPLGAFYLIKALGVYQTKEEILSEKYGQELWDKGIRPGDMKYYDKDGNGIYNDNDREIVGNPYPDFYGSLANKFAYKDFDFGIDLQFTYGNDIYSSWKTGNSAGHQGSASNAILKSEWDDRWTAEGTSNSIPRAVSEGAASAHNTLAGTSRYVEDGSFLRIKNITLGYNLPISLLKKIDISRCRIYATVNNLYTFTKYDGFDPEVTSSPTQATSRGVDMATIPQLRSFVFGLNLSF